MSRDGSPRPDADAGDAPAVAIRDLHKTFGSGEDAVVAVDGVSLDIAPGTAVGLLGPNGAGKTTTIKALLGLVVPTDGTAAVHGIDVQAEPARAYRRVGAMLEGARNVYWRLTVRENLRFFAALGGHRPGALRERHDALLERFALTGKADTAVRELSRGMKQKVSLACTLAREADVVFLDEPTLGLDIESSIELRRELRRLVEDESITVLVSSHDMDVIEDVCDRVVIMNDGRVVADDTVENLLSVFRTQTYEVTVTEPLTPNDREALAERFDATGFEGVGGRERFRAQVTGDGFYELIDRLRAGGYTVDTVDAVEPDLEEVFLQVTETAPAEGVPAVDGGELR